MLLSKQSAIRPNCFAVLSFTCMKFINMNLIWQVCLFEVDGNHVGQIGVKSNDNTAFCDKELKFGTVIQKATKSKTGHRAKYYLP